MKIPKIVMKISSLVIAAAGLWCLAGPVAAQSIEDKLRSELRSTVEQLHALQDTQAQLQADQVQAVQQRDQAQAALKQAQAELATAKGKSTAEIGGERALAAEKSSHALDREQLVKYKSAYETLQTASHSQETREQSEQKANQTQLQMCEANNARLYQVGHEILEAYESVGLGTVLKSREPFAQKQRVKYDMIAQDYGDSLYAGKFDPNATMPAAASTATASAAAESK